MAAPVLKDRIGVNPAYIYDKPVVLIIQERVRSFSGDDFTIGAVNQNGDGLNHPLLRCEGKVASLSGRKTFTSCDTGKPLFVLRKSHFSFPSSWYLEGPGGERFLDLQGRFTIGKAKLDAKFTSTVGSGGPTPVVLEVRGQFFDRSADINFGGVPVARVRREFNLGRDLLAGKQTYGVEVVPGVDVALIAAVVVALDEQRNEGKK